MASPKTIDPDSRARPRRASQNAGSVRPLSSSQVGTPPVIPNIPPRIPGSVPRSLSTSVRNTSRSNLAAISTNPPTAPRHSTSNTELGFGRKISPAPHPPTQSSALTASLATSPRPALAASPAGLVDHHPTPSFSRQSSKANIRSPHLDAQSGASTPRADESAISQLADVSNEEKAKVLRRHLVSAAERDKTPTPAETSPSPRGHTPDSGQAAYGARNGESSMAAVKAALQSGISISSERPDPREGEAFPIPYDAPGGDVTHDLYKWQHDHQARPVRSASFSHVPLDRSAILDPTLAHIKEPGGFRRNFVVHRAHEQGLEAPPVSRNLIDFLFLYGHFAGEDLEESDDEGDEIDGLPTLAEDGEGGGYVTSPIAREAVRGWSRRAPSGERAPLLGSRSMSKSRHRRTRSGPPVGTASATQATLMLLKGFVGTGILFMAKAFFNGGILFSTLMLLGIAAISLWSFMLLMQAYMVVPGSFGDIGGALYGNYMRLIILTSITISQIGFVAAYTIFIAENLQAFVLAVTDCRKYISVGWLIFAQLIIFLPLSMIRNIAKLSGTALVADAFILIGLIYIGVIETTVIAKEGFAQVALLNTNSYSLLVGTAVFAFEGIGLIIPITESMKQPQKLPGILSGVMLFVAILFAGFGVLGYGAYGKDIQTVVIVNLPQDDKFVQAVQFLYSIAILLSIPLQLFPAVRIMENGLFSRSGKHDPSVKWQKNLFRGATVLGCSLISWAGSSELDKFVSLIGSFACVPLCFIYPPLLHLRACAKSRMAKIGDYVFIAFGIGVGLFTTIQTLRSFAEGGGDAPKFGKCDIPT